MAAVAAGEESGPEEEGAEGREGPTITMMVTKVCWTVPVCIYRLPIVPSRGC